MTKNRPVFRRLQPWAPGSSDGSRTVSLRLPSAGVSQSPLQSPGSAPPAAPRSRDAMVGRLKSCSDVSSMPGVLSCPVKVCLCPLSSSPPRGAETLN